MRKLAYLSLFSIALLSNCQNKSMSKHIISTDKAPAAIGPYSQAVKVGNTLYCSGQIAIDPATGKLIQTSIEDETQQVMENIKAVLAEADMDFSHVVKASIFLSSMDHYQAVNKVYATYFGEKPPAREAVAVQTLPKQVNVEISVIAAD